MPHLKQNHCHDLANCCCIIQVDGFPPPIVTWTHNGRPVVTATDDPDSHRMLLPSSQLFFLKVVQGSRGGRGSDVGVYACTATNPETGFSVVSRNATLGISGRRGYISR